LGSGCQLLDRAGVLQPHPKGARSTPLGGIFKRTARRCDHQQLIYALDEQVRRWEAEGLVEKFEYWEFLGPILDGDGHCRGAVVQDMFAMTIRSLAADAVVLATGGCGLIYGRSTMSMICTGGAAGRAYKAGVIYANGEFVQVHPTAIPGTDKLRLMSESARGEACLFPKTAGLARPALHPRDGALLLPRRALPEIRQPRPPRHRHAGDFRRLRIARAERRGRADVRLSRCHGIAAAGAKEARRHP
jgi:succinate dehydrogenase/fumarate reductase flavoprotein subunit